MPASQCQLLQTFHTVWIGTGFTNQLLILFSICSQEELGMWFNFDWKIMTRSIVQVWINLAYFRVVASACTKNAIVSVRSFWGHEICWKYIFSADRAAGSDPKSFAKPLCIFFRQKSSTHFVYPGSAEKIYFQRIFLMDPCSQQNSTTHFVWGSSAEH